MEQWAELRREHFVRGVSIKELSRRTGLSRNRVRAALRSSTPPRYQRVSRAPRLDPFRTRSTACSRMIRRFWGSGSAS